MCRLTYMGLLDAVISAVSSSLGRAGTLCFLSAGNERMHCHRALHCHQVPRYHHIQLFTWVLEIQVQDLVLVQVALYQWSHLSAPSGRFPIGPGGDSAVGWW